MQRRSFGATFIHHATRRRLPDLLERLRAELSDRYRIEREIGSGGMAHVLLAHDLKHRRKVALKVLRPDLGSAVGADRFLREIEIAAQLSHPHIVPLYDSGTADGLLYYVMPFVEGESLRDRLTRETKIPVSEALGIATQVAGALAYAHSHGVMHRDIKPENVLLTAGHALVADFGIARAIAVAGGEQLTHTGVAVGTVRYMSPEQALGDSSIDGRSDVYSLGCVLYEMITGDTPFTGASAQAVVKRLLTEPAPALTVEHDRVPVEVQDLLTRSLAKQREERFTTAEEFAAALSSATTSATSAHIAKSPPRSRAMGLSRRTSIAIGAAIVIVGTALGFAAWRSRAGAASSVPNRVAVLPFAMHGGPQLAYLREGIVDLLSRNLEGVEDLQSVDAGTVMSALRGSNTDVIDAARGRALVTKMGAGSFVLGSVTSSGPRMRIQAALHGVQPTDTSPINASVEGDTSQLLELVDRLAADLLVKRRPGAAYRLTQTAALTTHSLPALKAFLNAEQLLRGRALDSAIAGYQRAIAEDSSFALAYYRLAVAAGWQERHALSSDAVMHALRVGGRLTERDRRLMTAYAVFRAGDADDAERQYRAVLEDFPDDLEAEFQLGDLLFQYNPLRGRPRVEARPMLDRVLAYDPGFL
jgi:tetratricopeptide (TPR) repeat protein